MPHDKNGLLVQPGDTVTMEFIVKEVSTGEEYCNLHLESVEKLYPGIHPTTLSAVNARQVVKVA